jgi:hypothetical protein
MDALEFEVGTCLLCASIRGAVRSCRHVLPIASNNYNELAPMGRGIERRSLVSKKSVVRNRLGFRAFRQTALEEACRANGLAPAVH